jgi:glutathione S-transferase
MVEVNAMKKQDWFLKLNPRGKVPALQNLEDGTVLYESAICDEYLCDVARELDADPVPKEGFWKLMPVSAREKAFMRLLNDHMDTVLGPAQYTFLMNDDPEKDKPLLETLEGALDVLQEALEKRGGPYLMGKEFTLAEAHILPFFLRLVVSLKHFKNYELSPEKYGKLLDWYELCSQRESVQAAAKSDEKIIEVYQKFVDMKYGYGGLNKNQN